MDITEVLLLLGILYITWNGAKDREPQDNMLMHAIAGLIVMFIAAEWISSYPGIGIMVFVLSVYILLKVIIIMGAQLGPAKGFSQFKAMYNNARGRFQRQ